MTVENQITLLEVNRPASHNRTRLEKTITVPKRTTGATDTIYLGKPFEFTKYSNKLARPASIQTRVMFSFSVTEILVMTNAYIAAKKKMPAANPVFRKTI